MSEAPERIWMDPDIKFPECEKQYGCDIGYVRLDLYEELEVKLSEALPNDGRPCSTDVFLGVLFNEIDDRWDRCDAIKSWLEGAWDEAVEDTSLEDLKEITDESS